MSENGRLGLNSYAYFEGEDDDRPLVFGGLYDDLYDDRPLNLDGSSNLYDDIQDFIGLSLVRFSWG